MPKRSVVHATFTVERIYDASPARVFEAFANLEAKSRWFKHPQEPKSAKAEMDFRVGGRETNVGGQKGGPTHAFNAVYHDIVPNERIIYAYDMHLDDKRISVSLATIEFKPAGKGTKLVFTEQGAFLDGYDDAGQREQGTRELLDALGASLRNPV